MSQKSLITQLSGRYIYSIGGCFGEEESVCLNTVERYDIIEERWESVAGMKMGRYSCGTAVLGNRIYVVGGFGYNPTTNESIPLDHCEYFNTLTGSWHDIEPLQIGRGAVSVVASGGWLYAIGGFCGEYLSTVERYDPIECRWSLCESLKSPRSGSGVGHINVAADELFAS